MSNGTILKHIVEWKCGEEENCSDHRILTFKNESEHHNQAVESDSGIRYIVKKENYNLFGDRLAANLRLIF